MNNLFLKQMTLLSLVSRDFPRLSAQSRLPEAAAFFRNTGADAAAVVDAEGKVEGIICGSDLLVGLGDPHPELRKIRDCAREPQLVLSEEDIAKISLGYLLEHGIQEVLIVDREGRFTGGILLNGNIQAVLNYLGGITESFAEVLDSVYNGVMVIDLNGTLISFNPMAEQFFNRKAEDVLGKNIHDVFPGSTLDTVVHLGEPQPAYRLQVGGRTAISNRTPLVMNGKIIGAVAVFQDITDLESISGELESTKKLKAILEAVVENPHEGLIAIDENSRVILINQYYLDVTGLTREQALGKHVYEVTPHSELPETVKTGRVQIGEFWKVNGKEMIIMRTPIKEGDKIIGAIGKSIFKDMIQAWHFVDKLNQLENELEYYREELRKTQRSAEYTFEQIIGESTMFQDAKALALCAAKTFSTVLITGESGTGKEVFAHAIHNCSKRKKGPFIKVNCAALPEQLLESELFGYVEGAFTGARKGGKPGKFELANNGTIFLDEIGDMTLTMQAKLLRVIQEKEIERVGGTETTKVNVRIIAATNRNLAKMVEENKFRADLFYRLNVMPLELPALRDRSEDIPSLAHYLINRLNHQLGTAVKEITPEAMELLCRYSWPGNVRELENVLERIMNVYDECLIFPEHLPAHLRRAVGKRQVFPAPLSLESALFEAEKETIIKALALTKGNKAEAAKALGIHRSVLYRKLSRFRGDLAER